MYCSISALLYRAVLVACTKSNITCITKNIVIVTNLLEAVRRVKFSYSRTLDVGGGGGGGEGAVEVGV